MASKTRIIKAAVVRLGEEAPQAITEDTDALIAAEALYDEIVEEALTRHGWSFAKRTRTLVRTDTTPAKPWLYVYAMPAGGLNIRDLTDECGVPVDYEVIGNTLLSRHEGPLTLIETWRPSEERWPADFAGAIQEELLGQLLGAFEERIRSIEVREIAAGKMSRAFQRDMRQNPPRRVSNSPLLRAWFGLRTRRA